MITVKNKFEKYCKLFYDNFIIIGDPSINGINIPLARITEGTGYVEDGTINLAHYTQFLYNNYLLNHLDTDLNELNNCIETLKRLCTTCYKYFVNTYPNINFKYYKGFFLRDDIATCNDPFDIPVHSGFKDGIEYDNEDVCFSPFVSQDQIWNLLPILCKLHHNKEISILNSTILWDILVYLVNNNYTLYNPYYSTIYHQWTYCNLKVPYSDRIKDRDEHVKLNIKVKRGANSWYFAGGFANVFKSIGGVCNTFIPNLWYKPFIWLADNIYHPHICKWFKLPVKNNSYYCLNIASGNKKYYKKLVNKFNKSLKDSITKNTELNEDYAWLIFLLPDEYLKQINDENLEAYLELYELNEEYESGNLYNCKSPLFFMNLYVGYLRIKNLLM